MSIIAKTPALPPKGTPRKVLTPGLVAQLGAEARGWRDAIRAGTRAPLKPGTPAPAKPAAPRKVLVKTPPWPKGTKPVVASAAKGE